MALCCFRRSEPLTCQYIQNYCIFTPTQMPCDHAMQRLLDILFSQQSLSQLGLIVASFLLALGVSAALRNRLSSLKPVPVAVVASRKKIITHKIGRYVQPLLSVLFLKIAVEFYFNSIESDWLIRIAITVVIVFAYLSFLKDFVENRIACRAMLIIGVPLILLQSLGALPYLNSVLESIYVEIGNIRITLSGILRVAIFGSLLFWIARVSNSTGQEVIRKQESIDFRTREVAAKLFEIGVIVAVMLLLLQIMGINLTALAVFGGALGVGLGFGLQAITSNFVSGLIILFDRSLSKGDFVELEDGRSGFVTALNMRSTTLETFDGKDIMVPNETFITSSFANCTRKDQKQRYRVDFSVAYDSDIRKLVDLIKEAVALHPQVLSGEEYPIEERPDCEIDGFGDSGVNMFVEFWIEAIDDGKNRVGGDLLLIIFETMRENGFTIPFPQREVRILNDSERDEIRRSLSA